MTSRPSALACSALLLLVLTGACSKSPIKVLKMPDGTRELTCDFPLWKCVAQVDDYCKGTSFEVLYAEDQQHLYGSPGSEVESRTSRAVIHCLGPHSKPFDEAAVLAAAPAPAQSAAPPPAVSVAPAAAAAPAAPAAPARACLPGTTQVCVGPAACSGGQSCLSDGSGFSACDCGAAKAPEPAAPAAPQPRK